MDSRIEQIVRGFERLLKGVESSFLAKVTAIDSEVVTVEDMNGTTYPSVRKSATEGERGFILTPTEGSWVVVSRLSNSNSLFVSMVSEVDAVEFMGGENGGMVKIGKLESKLNQLVSEVNALKSDYTSHTHPTPSGASSAPAVPFKGTFSQFSKSDFENEKVTH